MLKMCVLSWLRCSNKPTKQLAMLTEDWLSLAAIVICLCFSFFFSASETSLTAVSRARLLRLEKAGSRRARWSPTCSKSASA